MSGLPVSNAANTVERLGKRIASNQSASAAFPRFVLDVLSPQASDHALDIGPGLGAQMLPVSERVERAVGLEVSSEMAAELRSRLRQPNAVVVCGDMDDLGRLDLGRPFTLVYAVYSLYYSRDPGRTVATIADRLAGERSRFVTVNPDVGNNETWHADLAQLYELPADIVAVPQVGRRVILPALLDTFRTVRSVTHEDRVRFANLPALMDYYDGCAPYCRPDKRAEAAQYFGAKIDQHGAYEIRKRSLALIGSR
jgi:hypothetical protein